LVLSITDDDTSFKLPFFGADVETRAETLGVLDVRLSTARLAEAELLSFGVPPAMVSDIKCPGEP